MNFIYHNEYHGIEFSYFEKKQRDAIEAIKESNKEQQATSEKLDALKAKYIENILKVQEDADAKKKLVDIEQQNTRMGYGR